MHTKYILPGNLYDENRIYIYSEVYILPGNLYDENRQAAGMLKSSAKIKMKAIEYRGGGRGREDTSVTGDHGLSRERGK